MKRESQSLTMPGSKTQSVRSSAKDLLGIN
jgi:hypothetical protein